MARRIRYQQCLPHTGQPLRIQWIAIWPCAWPASRLQRQATSMKYRCFLCSPVLTTQPCIMGLNNKGIICIMARSESGANRHTKHGTKQLYNLFLTCVSYHFISNLSQQQYESNCFGSGPDSWSRITSQTLWDVFTQAHTLVQWES